MGKKDYLKQNTAPAAIPFTADAMDGGGNSPGVRPEHFTNISTHENVSIFYENAGIATRYAAYVIDMLIRIVFWAALAAIFYFAFLRDYIFGEKVIEASDNFLNGVIMTVMIIYFSIFFVRLLYFTLFEGIMRGRTPGKSAMSITVVSVSGEAPTVSQIIVRNLMRFLHMIPGGELADGIVAVCSRKAQRLGDMAAGTMVIKVRRQKGAALQAAGDQAEGNAGAAGGNASGSSASYMADGSVSGIEAIESAEKEEADFLAEMKERLRREYSSSAGIPEEAGTEAQAGEEAAEGRKTEGGTPDMSGASMAAQSGEGTGIIFENDTPIPGGFLNYGEMLMLGNYLYSRNLYAAKDEYDQSFARIMLKKSGAEIPKNMNRAQNLLYLRQTYNYHYLQWDRARGGGTYGGNI